jgi:hypothetical protein
MWPGSREQNREATARDGRQPGLIRPGFATIRTRRSGPFAFPSTPCEMARNGSRRIRAFGNDFCERSDLNIDVYAHAEGSYHHGSPSVGKSQSRHRNVVAVTHRPNRQASRSHRHPETWRTAFHKFDSYERLLDAAQRIDWRTYLIDFSDAQPAFTAKKHEIPSSQLAILAASTNSGGIG